MDLKQLRHLICLAETGSFSRAAERLNLTQSALSRSIQALEAFLNIQLIDRAGKRNELTPLGKIVVARSRRVVFEADEIEEDLRRLNTFDLGALSVGMDPAPTALLLAPFLAMVAQRYPGLHLTVKREGPESHLNALRSRELDALVIDPRNLPPSDEFKVELVTNFRSGFIVRRDHPLAGAESLDFAALLDYPMTSSPFSDEAARSMVMQFGHSANPAQFITMTCDDWKSMLNAVRVTDAINLGAIAIARELIAAGELVELNVTPRLQTTVRMALVTMAGRVELPAMKVLRAFVEETLQTENARA